MHKPGLVASLATRPSPRSSCLDPSAGKRWLPTSRTTGNGCAGYQAPPSYDQHTGRARRGRAGAALCRASRPEGGIQRTVSAAPAVVRAEASRRARVALLSAWGISVGHQGGRNARTAFPSPPPNLLLQDSAPAGHAASWVPQKSLCKTCIDYIPP